MYTLTVYNFKYQLYLNKAKIKVSVALTLYVLGQAGPMLLFKLPSLTQSLRGFLGASSENIVGNSS